MSKFYVFLLGFILLNATHMHAGDQQDRNLRRGSKYQNSKIATGGNHTLEIRNGKLWARGLNDYGQLGDGTTTNRKTPVQIGSSDSWVSAACGDDFSLGLRADGTLWAWGANYWGQLGDGSGNNKYSPVQVGTGTDWVSVAAGVNHTLAIKSDGTLWSWGDNTMGQLGYNTSTTPVFSPVQVGTANNWVSVKGGSRHSLALRADGTLWSWGYNFVGQLGDGTTTNRTTPAQVGTADNWVNISAGQFHSIALRANGTIWTWGWNGYGQLGDGTTTNRSIPIQTGSSDKWVNITAGRFHSMGVKANGTLWAWGRNFEGQLGDGTTTNKSSPVQAGSADTWVNLASGWYHCLGMRADGTLWGWGNNAYGQLGDGTNTNRSSPIQVRTAPAEWVQVKGGYRHSLGLKTDGSVWAWGDNTYGSLGNGTTNNSSSPIRVGTANNWVSISTGYYHSLGLRTDGTLWAWGYNGYGELGDGTNTQRNSPIQVGAGANWVSIASGQYFTIGLRADGTLWTWGRNTYGQLGDGTNSNKSSPVQVGTDTNWVNITAGGYHCLAVKSDGTLWAWGRNFTGQIGDGTTNHRSSPVQVGTDTNWVSVSAGLNFSTGLKSNGTLWGWGHNYAGQLGDGTFTDRYSPVQIGTANDWIMSAGGGHHSAAIKADGTLWTWGFGDEGSLGDGTTANRNSPVQVGTSKEWVSVSGGYLYTMVLNAQRNKFCATGENISGQLGDGTTTNRNTFVCALLSTPVTIPKQPYDTTICNGNNAAFVVTATSATSYQWQVNSGSGWTNLTNTGIYSGADNDTLLLTAPTSNVDSNRYRVVINGTDTSDSAQIFINTPPNIVTQPTPKTICDGDSVTFSVTTTGTADSFQWYGFTGSFTGNVTDGTYPQGIVSGSHTNTLAIANTSSSISGYKFFVVAMGPCSLADTSDSALLTVNTAPSITTQPVNRTICEGDTTTYTMAATGTGLTYQWYYTDSLGLVMLYMMDGTYSWGTVSGATTGTMTLSNVSSTINGLYFKGEVSGTCAPPDTSNLVSLTVNTLPNITAEPTSKTICAGSNTTYSVTATGAGLTYQWQASINGGISYNNLSNSGIYSGVTTNTLALTNPTSGYDGIIYRAIVSGSCMPADTSDTASLTINTAPSIISYPSNKTICDGGSTNFSLFATGTNVTYQWQVSTNGGGTWNNVSNGGIYSGATNTVLYITGAPASMNNYKYRAIASGTCAPSETSIEVTLTFNTIPNITANPTNKTICEGNNTSYSVTATGTGLTYQWQVHDGTSWSDVTNTGIYSGATTSTLSLTAATASYNDYQYRAIVNGTCTPSDTSDIVSLTVNTAPNISSQPANSIICNGANTSFTVAATGAGLTYQWQVYNGTSWSNVTNTGIYSGATTNTLTLTNATVAVHNYQYRCMVSGACTPAATSNAALLFIKTSPVVTTHPTSKLICQGNNTSYSVAGTSTYTISYQWQGSVDGISWSNIANSGIFSGATTATLNLTGAYIGTFTKYRCVLSTGCINATSNVANLAIETAPLISINPSNQVKCVGQNASFAISATGSNITYQWEVSTNGGATWGNVANGGVYSGATTNNLALTAPPATMNAYRYRCVVTGSCPTAKTSASATLTVNTPVAINTNTPTALTYCSGSNTSLTVGATGTGISYRWYINTGGVWTALNNGGMYSGVTTSTLNITGLPAATNTLHYLYRCVVTGTCNTVSSNTTDITVYARPTITSNPSNVTRCDSTYNVSFKTTATGSQLVYQWQLNTGSGWNNLVNNSLYNGVSTPNLEVANAYYSMNGYQYRCVITGICTPTATTSVATLTVNPLVLPSATVSVSDDDICMGSSVTFTPTPTNGGTNPTYVWKRNGAAVATGSTYTTTALANGDLVWCDMTSNIACPSPKTVKSDNAITMKVTQYSTPAITVTSDVGTSWCSGKPAVFRSNITNGGTKPAYEWQVNGQPVGANIDTYLAAQLLDGDQVRCRMTSNLKCPSPVTVTSNTLTMTINQTTRSSIVITPNPDSVICNNTEVTMYTYYTNAGPTPSFQWMLNGADIPGETGGTMKITSLSNGDMIQCRFISSATCVFPEESLPVSFSVNQLIDPSVGVIVYYVGNETFRFTAIPTNGGANPSYQWYKNTVPIPGATSETYDAVGIEKTDKIHVQMASSEACVNPELLQVNSKIITTGTAELSKTFADMSLYPNPNKGQFNIKGTLNKPVTSKDVMVRITNSLGQTVFTQSYPANGINFNLPIQLQYDLPNGMYQVNIAIDGDVTNLRFVLNR